MVSFIIAMMLRASVCVVLFASFFTFDAIAQTRSSCPVQQLAMTMGHSCVLTTDRSVYCWGANSMGQLGDGTRDPHELPQEVASARGANAVSVGFGRTCVERADRSHLCWGRNYERRDHVVQWNDPPGRVRVPRVALSEQREPAEILVPTRVVSMNGLRRIAVGSHHLCGIDAGSNVQCWGENGWGQLGNPVLSVVSGTPSVVPGLRSVEEVSVAMYTSCARTTDATVTCWGQVQALGPGDRTQQTPWNLRRVSGLQNVEQISVGDLSSCARLRDGTVHCWGNGVGGIMGNQSTNGTDTPVRVQGVSNARHIAVGGSGACAVSTDGTVRCWGEDLVALLGDGTYRPQTSPAMVPGIRNAVEVRLGTRELCVLRADQSVACLRAAERQTGRAASMEPLILPPCH